MAIPSSPLHNIVRISSSAAIKGVPGKVWAVLLNGGTAATNLKLTNDADGNGTAVVNVVAPFTDSDASSQSSMYIDFTSMGGIDFSSKIYATIAGTGAEAFVWYD